jgi:hypothetical protein
MMRSLAVAAFLSLAAAAGASSPLTIGNVYLLPSSLPTGQNITVAVQVNNSPAGTVVGVSTTVDAAGAVFLSGPSPMAQSISAGGSANFTWVFQAQGCGQIYFTAKATGYDSASSTTTTSAPQMSAVGSSNCTPSPSPTPSPVVTATPTPDATPWIIYATATPGPKVGDATIPGNLYHPLQDQALQLRFEAPYEGVVSIDLYDRIGQRVRHFDLQVNPGTYTQLWDGRNDQGLMVSSGIYVAQFKGKGLFRAVKFAVIK